MLAAKDLNMTNGDYVFIWAMALNVEDESAPWNLTNYYDPTTIPIKEACTPKYHISIASVV